MNTDTENLKLSLDAHALVALGDALDAADEGGCAEEEEGWGGEEEGGEGEEAEGEGREGADATGEEGGCCVCLCNVVMCHVG